MDGKKLELSLPGQSGKMTKLESTSSNSNHRFAVMKDPFGPFFCSAENGRRARRLLEAVAKVRGREDAN